MTWFTLRVEPSARRDEAMAALFAAGAQGVHEDGTALVTHFAGEAEAESAARAVASAAPLARCTVQPSPEVDWATAWRIHARTFELNRLTIAPPWLADGVPAERLVVIDPGMAFGTGDHPSTRGAARLLESVMVPGATVADLGSGSGVQSIVAAKLGASRAWAIESDPDAQGNAVENIARNDVGAIVHPLEGDAAVLLPLVAPVDIIVANIISSIIPSLLPVMAASMKPGGVAILAGMLEAERDAMVATLDREGWSIRREDREDDWWSTLVARS